MNSVITFVTENMWILIMSIVSVIVLCGISFAVEKITDSRSEESKANSERMSAMRTRKLVVSAMLTAIAVIFMYFDFPLPFLPSFYKLDFSELPVIIGAFTYGPLTGVIIEFSKILIKTLIKGSSTAFVGEYANFLIGCAFIVPASVMYYVRKKRSMAVIGLITGCILCTVTGCLLNIYVLLPTYAKVFHMELDAIIGLGTKANSSIKDMFTFIAFATAPLNLIKTASVSLVTLCIYKPLSRVIKYGNR